MVKTFIIMAAGYGSRFNSLTFVVPKPLIRFWDKPILEITLQNIEANLPEIDRVLVITGFKRKLIEEYIELVSPSFSFELQSIPAFNYKKGNGSSLLAVQPYVEDDFYLAMCDHIFEENIYRELSLSNSNADLSLCVDYDPLVHIETDEATKVLLDGRNNILNIGKELKEWNAIDTGIFKMNSVIFERLREVNRDSLTISDGVRRMIRNGDYVKGIDVSGSYWADIDTYTDLSSAEFQLTPYAAHFNSIKDY
ncbi:MAG: phosphocholine cytidylyltransferase family protein [Candidatus Hodarchaeales archaeon]